MIHVGGIYSQRRMCKQEFWVIVMTQLKHRITFYVCVMCVGKCGCHGMSSNHRKLDCLLNILHGLKSKESMNVLKI